jgi:hypothetical protein
MRDTELLLQLYCSSCFCSFPLCPSFTCISALGQQQASALPALRAPTQPPLPIEAGVLTQGLEEASRAHHRSQYDTAAAADAPGSAQALVTNRRRDRWPPGGLAFAVEPVAIVLRGVLASFPSLLSFVSALITHHSGPCDRPRAQLGSSCHGYVSHLYSPPRAGHNSAPPCANPLSTRLLS